jgi:NADH-quinone oxidoreductase subunit M
MEIESLITVVTFLPLFAGLVLLATGIAASALGTNGLPESAWRWVGLAITGLTFLLSLGFFSRFDPTDTGYQFVEHLPWIAEFGINYFVGIDGISLWLVLLTTFLMPITLLASWNDIGKSVRSYIFFMLFLETGMLGAFVSLNLFQFGAPTVASPSTGTAPA